MTQSVDFVSLKKLDRQLEELLKAQPEERRRLHGELAKMAKIEVDQQIGARLNGGARVKAWQERYVGSGGGYAAVRATNQGAGRLPGNGPGSPGAITNYLEGGHEIRMPKKAKRRRKSRAKLARVPGRYFYVAARGAATREAENVVKRFADQIANRIGGSS